MKNKLLTISSLFLAMVLASSCGCSANFDSSSTKPSFVDDSSEDTTSKDTTSSDSGDTTSYTSETSTTSDDTSNTSTTSEDTQTTQPSIPTTEDIDPEQPIIPEGVNKDNIKLYGISDVDNWPVGVYFDVFKGTKATANDDAIDISTYLECNGTVNYGKAGVYTLKYEVIYNESHVTEERKVTVIGEDSLTPEVPGGETIDPDDPITPDDPGEDTPVDVKITYVRTYNSSYMTFSYNVSPFNIEGHIFSYMKVNGEQAWSENLPNENKFNVHVGDTTKEQYVFEWVDGNSVSYLSIQYEFKSSGEEGQGEVDTTLPEGAIDFGFVCTEMYGTYYCKVKYNIDPFLDEYDFDYYTVNGEKLANSSWKVKDGDVYQLYIGTNKAGTYCLRFYNKSGNIYGGSTFTYGVNNKAHFNKLNTQKGNYATGEIDIDHPQNPANLEPNLLEGPVPTNTWFSGMFINPGITALCVNQYKVKYANAAIAIGDVGKGGVQTYKVNKDVLTDKPSVTYSNFTPDLNNIFVKPASLTNNTNLSIISYTDNSVKMALRNQNKYQDEMVMTISQGSPYVTFETNNNQEMIIDVSEAGSSKAFNYYDLNGNLLKDSYKGDAIVLEMKELHRGYAYDGNCPDGGTSVGAPIFKNTYYLINAPKGSTFKMFHNSANDLNKADRVVAKPNNGNYLTIAPLGDSFDSISNGLTMIERFHKHAYSVHDRSIINYEVNHSNNVITTTFRDNIHRLDKDDTNDLLYALYPHQYKKTTSTVSSYYISSMRGKIRFGAGKFFTTKLNFAGLLPGFTTPLGSDYNNELTLTYLAKLDETTAYDGYYDHDNKEQNPKDDCLDVNEPYWNSKALYPLAQGLIIADQLHNETYKTKFITKIRYILEDWFTYTGDSDDRFLYYNSTWNALYSNRSDFGVNNRLTDHHFTFGYLAYASAVLSMFDTSFLDEYSDIMLLLVKDYANYDRNDKTFPYLRTFDSYSGHSWSDGFGNAGDGNNQESSGEALNSWVGAYLTGLIMGNSELVDASIYGYVSELYSVKQYWFDYDEDNWYNNNIPAETNIHALAMIWGAKNEYQTWFGPSPEFIYGIQWLPTGEYLTSYALGSNEQNMLGKIYNSFKTMRGGEPLTWFSNMWAIESLTKNNTAKNKFDATKILNDDYPNELIGSYWMIEAMSFLGNHSDTDYMRIESNVASSVYVNSNGVKIAMVWNASKSSKTVSFVINGEVVNKTVPAGFSSITL